MDLPPVVVGCPAAVTNAHEASLHVKRAKLFNLLPTELGGLDGVLVDTFKKGLDS